MAQSSDAVIKQFLELAGSLPFASSPRHDALRPDILRRLAAQLLTDDERASYLGLPAGCRIREGAKILSPEKLVIGEHCWIGENAILDASGGLEIGEHTSIGLSVFVWSHSSHLANLNLQNFIGSDLIERKPTRIGRGCFIAGPSVVMPGVTIGDQVVVMPMSVVSTNIPDRSIVQGDKIREGVWSDRVIERSTSIHRTASKRGDDANK